MGCVQLISDKSQTSLNASVFTYYFIHTTLLNCSERVKRLQRNFPCNHVCAKSNRFGKLHFEISKWPTRNGSTITTNECIEICLWSLSEVACKGHSCQLRRTINHFLHFQLASHDAESPLGLKQDIKQRPRALCVRNKKKCYIVLLISPERRLVETLTLMGRAYERRMTEKRFGSQFAEGSALFVLSVLSKFYLASIHSSVNVFTFFGVEPMHCHSLRVGRMRKECIVYMESDGQRVSSSVWCFNKKMRASKCIKRPFLPTLNLVLCRCTEMSPGYKRNVDFHKARITLGLTRLLREDELLEMLEASDFDAVDDVSPLLSTFIGSICGLLLTAEVTRAMTKYVDTVNVFRNRSLKSESIVDYVMELNHHIRSFNSNTSIALGMFQASRCWRKSATQ